jgi:hypothetical protein
MIEHAMTHHIALFRFRLSAAQSIGPAALRKLWSAACGSNDVNVCRVTSGLGYGDTGRSYSLWAPPNTANLWAIETRLRELLADTFPSAAINLTTL